MDFYDNLVLIFIFIYSLATFGTAVFIVGVARSWCDRASFLVSLSLAVACAGASIGGSGIVILGRWGRNSPLVLLLTTFASNLVLFFIIF